VTFEDDLAAEGEPEAEFIPGIAERMPHKTVAAGVLIRDPDDRILFVIPNYKPYLDIPGGIVEAGEPPSQAARREVAEEVGLDLAIGRLLVVDWSPGRGVWSDQVQFVFDGGVVEPGVTIRLAPDELAGLRWLTVEQARPELRPSLYRRIALAVEAADGDAPIHAEFGRAR
jgi:ADP-ribose pyrophosphatase YjhB (NUDIX family)